MDHKEERASHRSGQDIINQLSVILRTAQIHDSANIAVTSAIDKYLALINPLTASEDIITLELVGEFFYINETRVRYSLEYLLSFDYLVREFRKREIGKVIFKDVINAEDLRIFLKSFIAAGFSETPYDVMNEKMAESAHIDVERLRKISEGEAVDTTEDSQESVL